MQRRELCLLLVLAACGHRHGPTTNTDVNRLFVEVTPEGKHKRELRAGTERALGDIRFVDTVDDGGEIELIVEVSRLDEVGSETMCSVKILIIALPQHDLIGIADASARARGTDGHATDACLSQVSATLVRNKVRSLLQRRLHAKR